MKQTRRLLLLASALLLTSANVTAARDPLSDVIKRVKRAVVVITTYNAGGRPLLRGSGFFVEADRVVTSGHLLDGAHRAQVETFDGKILRVWGIVAANECSDLALLQTEAPPSATMPLTVAGALPSDGEEIIVFGNPEGSSWKVSRGVTLGVWDFAGVGKLIHIEASISPGSSGGPVVNREGSVIGVATMQVSGAEMLNFALPAELVKALCPGRLRPLPGDGAQQAAQGIEASVRPCALSQ